MNNSPDVVTLVEGLLSESDGPRKYAVFKLQGLLADPEFADAFIQADGLLPLRQAVMQTSGNTQAYALGSLDALLELDMGWECCDPELLGKAVSLAISHPLINIVRNALTLLVYVVSRPLNSTPADQTSSQGFTAIKPALDKYPDFLASLVQRLSASDHKLCANALQLLNALMRDAVMHGGEHEWPKFIKRLQDLGVIGGVGMLMRGDAASDAESALAAAIVEFEGLTKMLLRKWKEVPVSVELAEHKRALKTIHLLSKPEPYNPGGSDVGVNGGDGSRPSRRHHPEKWRRLGFETESPAWEFDETGYLGIMDLVEYVRRNEDVYQKTLMEQSVQPASQRCPLARASLGVTLILYEHFEIDGVVDSEYVSSALQRAHGNPDFLYRPLLLQWGRLHTAAMNAFIRLWKDAGAEADDFYKIEEVVRIIVERIVGAAGRRTEIGRVEEELRVVGLAKARGWQMENLDEVYHDAWGPHLTAVREQLHHESLQFMKEQRIRCLLAGDWFPATATGNSAWRFVRLSPNRRYLHHRMFTSRGGDEVALAELPDTIDLNNVTSVDSNVSAAKAMVNGGGEDGVDGKNRESAKTTTTKITILGTAKISATPGGGAEERALLELFPQTSYLASEWLDGLLMLLNQQPITKDTTRLVAMMEDWGVRLRILNLRWEDVDWESLELSVKGEPASLTKEVPSRDGLTDEYWYAMPEV